MFWRFQSLLQYRATKYGTYGKSGKWERSSVHQIPRHEPKLLQEWTRCSWNVASRSVSVRLVYSTVDAVSHITIYTATSDSYSTCVTAHFSPQRYEWELVQATEVRESARSRGKGKGAFASSLSSKLRVVPSRIGKHISRGRRRQEGTV